MKTVAVLGGTGFLGRHVMRHLKERGVRTHALSRHEGCDIMDRTALAEKLAALRPFAVVNCAAHVGSLHYVRRRAADVIHDNMQMILNIYRAVSEACPGATLVNPISNCSYPGDAMVHDEGDWQKGPVHESVLPYASTRRMIHAFADSYRAQHGLRSVNWLIANAYGPGDSTDPDRVHALNGILIRMIRAQRAGEKTFEIWGSGRPTREWVYIVDAAAILAESVDVLEQVEPLNLAQNHAYSISEIARLAAEALDYPVGFTFNTSYPDGAPSKILDDARFRARYPDFRFTPLREGIAHTIDYYREHLPAEPAATGKGG